MWLDLYSISSKGMNANTFDPNRTLHNFNSLLETWILQIAANDLYCNNGTDKQIIGYES